MLALQQGCKYEDISNYAGFPTEKKSSARSPKNLSLARATAL